MLPPDLAPVDTLADYRAEFLEHYGTDALVPVKQLLDPHIGIGPPAGYLRPPSDRRPAPQDNETTDRDLLLCGLAERAAAQGMREMVLDDDLVQRLDRDTGATVSGSYAEVCAQLLADSADALREGDFRLLMTSANFTSPGAMFGRFLYLVPDLVPRLGDLATELTADGSGAAPTQLTYTTLHPRSGNVSQVPAMTSRSIVVGAFADRSSAHIDGLDDLTVGADRERFYVVSRRSGREVVPLSFNALATGLALPNATRFLVEVGQARTPSWPLWNWGKAAQLPYLPRIRYGRTVLTSARWLVDPELTDPSLDFDGWLPVFESWRTAWNVPDVVFAVTRDWRIRIALDATTQLRLLYDDLRRRPGLVLTEEPAGGEVGTGWSDGHAAEIVVPLRPARGRSVREAKARAASVRAHQPGGEWLYLKIYAAAGRHDELLTAHLSGLIERVRGLTDRWFFLRYRDDQSHLRIRFHGDPVELNARLLPVIHHWATDLAGAGLIRDIMLDTYRPEITRYGGPETIEAAERAFCADSHSVLEQLALRARGLLDLPMELLVAANYLDLARHLHPHGWQGWLLETYPKDSFHTAFQRHRREATRLLDPDMGGPALAEIPGGERLLDSWRRRAPHIAAYGRLLSELAPDAAQPPASPLTSLLHLHHNRLTGINRHAEQESSAIARGVVQTHLDRKRHLDA